MGNAVDMGTASLPVRARVGTPNRSKRLLSLAGDERLVASLRRGNETAFEVAFERHSPAILAFCRHMLGSHEEAEDAVQHTFAAAYRSLLRDREREIVLKPWLFAIARNRCFSMLRARRDTPSDDLDLPTPELAEEVERRAELRVLLADLRELPEDQRAALLLAEVSDLSHEEVGRVLGCQATKVKALVYRARSSLIARRAAREAPCEEIREQLANLRGGALRRTQLRLHLRDCPECRSYREQVRRQRELLATALPVVPTLGLKGNVLAAAGIGGATAAGGAAGGGAIATGGGALVAKVAIVSVLAGAGIAGGQAVVSSHHAPGPSPADGVGRFDHRDGYEHRPTPGSAGVGGTRAARRAPAAEASPRGRGAPAAKHGAPRTKAVPKRTGAPRAAPKAPKHTPAPRAGLPHGGALKAKGPKVKAPKAKAPQAKAPKRVAPKAKAHLGSTRHSSAGQKPVKPSR
jgi:RNA polymerase sigma factor (sigma-70 family)